MVVLRNKIDRVSAASRAVRTILRVAQVVGAAALVSLGATFAATAMSGPIVGAMVAVVTIVAGVYTLYKGLYDLTELAASYPPAKAASEAHKSLEGFYTYIKLAQDAFDKISTLQNATGKILDRAGAQQRRGLSHNPISGAQAAVQPGLNVAQSMSLETNAAFAKRAIGVAWAQGKRDDMQDVWTVKTFSKGTIVGLFDGHGEDGDRLATLAKNATVKALIKKLEGLDVLTDPQAVGKAIKDVFPGKGREQYAARDTVQGTLKTYGIAEHSGTTALVAIMLPSGTYMANLGDCRALGIAGHKATRRTFEHTVDQARELSKVRRKTGASPEADEHGTLRIGGLIPTQTLGDTAARLMRRAEVTFLPPGHDPIMMGCDGILDVTGDKAVATFVSQSEGYALPNVAPGPRQCGLCTRQRRQPDGHRHRARAVQLCSFNDETSAAAARATKP